MNHMMRWLVMCGMMIIGLLAGCEEDSETGAGYRGHERVQERTARAAGRKRAQAASAAPSRSTAIPPPKWQWPHTPNYATDIKIVPVCDQDPYGFAVTNDHAEPSICEYVSLVATHNVNGVTQNVPATFVWSTSDPSIIESDCVTQGDHDLCRVFGKQDLFDMQSAEEPSAKLTACVVNTCPKPTPQDCADYVCTSRSAASVVNLEGSWKLAGPLVDGETTYLIQDGRRIFDDSLDLEHGEVIDATVVFDRWDYAYIGTIAADRTSMQGTVTDMLSDTIIGNWSAVKTGP